MIADIVQAVLPIIEKVVPDKGRAAEMAHEIATMQMRGELDVVGKQLEINKVEAAHRNVFVAGWRPAIGWSGAAAVFFNFVGLPLAQMLGWADPAMKPLDLSQLWAVIIPMLGVAGLRSIEKLKGAAR